MNMEEARDMCENYQADGSIYELASFFWDWQESCRLKALIDLLFLRPIPFFSVARPARQDYRPNTA